MDFDVKKLISTEDVKERVKDIIENEMVIQIEYALGDSIRKQVTEFIGKEIAPDVVKELIKNKEKFINQFKDSVEEIILELGKNMVAIVIKNMEEKYSVIDVIKKLFGIY